ncbi:MAG: ABC transporter substrate-binding protein [Bacteriovoracaceae bacterium]
MKSFFRLLTVLSLLSLAYSCTKKTSSKNSELKLSLTAKVSTLDPANGYDTVSASVIYQSYEQLYQYHYLKRPYTIEPLLAESLPEVLDNGLTYKIKIRKGIQYHGDPAFKGQPRYLKAEDFVNQIKRLAFVPTNSNGWWLFDGKIKGINAWRKEVGNDKSKFFTTKVEGIETPNDYTLIIKLSKPYPQMLYALTMSFTSPVPKEAIEHYDHNLTQNVVGTGPYELENWTRHSSITLKKFKGYRKELYPTQGDRYSHRNNLLADAGKQIPFIEKIVFQVITEERTKWLNFRGNKLDLLALPRENFDSSIDENGELVDELKKEKIQLQVSPTLTYWWLSFNMKDPLLGNNLKLRQAIAHGIDRERYIRDFTVNTGQAANSIYPPGIPGYDPGTTLPFTYDIEKAKKLLAEAGYPEGKGLPEIKFDVRGGSTVHRNRGEYFKNELSKIGIKVKVVTNTFPIFLDKARKGKLQLWRDGWAMDYPDAENSLQLLYSKNHSPGPNSTYYHNPKVDRLFDRLKVLKDGEEKFAIMSEIEKLVQADLPWIMQHYTRTYVLLQDKVKNYRQSDIVYNYLKYINLK